MIYLPVYEYECCNGHKFIVTEPIINTHKPPKDCKQCGENLVRIFGSPTIRFNGTGWGKD
jgi:putative FmdB family regulatory protein